jgi:hypothetical protein
MNKRRLSRLCGVALLGALLAWGVVAPPATLVAHRDDVLHPPQPGALAVQAAEPPALGHGHPSLQSLGQMFGGWHR